MSVSITQVAEEVGVDSESSTTSGNGTSNGASGSSRPTGQSSTTGQEHEAMIVIPAGFFGDILGGLSGTIGEVTGGLLGDAKTGRKVGDAASPLIKMLPFSAEPPSGGQSGSSIEESLILVPAGFLGGVLGGIGGNLLGGTIGGWLGNKSAGEAIGKTAGGIVGGFLPFQVVPPQVSPQSAGPGAESTPEDAMIVVPAGFFGNLLSGVANTVAALAPDGTVKDIARGSAPLLDLVPFQTAPPEIAPQSTGPGGGTDPEEELIVLPAGYLGDLLGDLAVSVGGKVGAHLGEAAGEGLGSLASPYLKMLPFHAVPPAFVAQSAGPASGNGAQEQMIFVPAGLFGNLAKSMSGMLSRRAVTSLTGSAAAGEVAGTLAESLTSLLPFSVVAPQSA